MVFQGAMHSLNPVIRVGDQVGERLRADGLGKQQVEARVDELLGRVGLPAGIGRRYPHELSGGMKQRVMIATALTHDPPLLILDEPTSALDVSIQAQIMNLLKELKAERRISMLFITHDLALASDLCDHIAVVYAGQLREHGSAEAGPGTAARPLHAGPPGEHPQPPRRAAAALPARRPARPARRVARAAASRRAARWSSSACRTQAPGCWPPPRPGTRVTRPAACCSTQPGRAAAARPTAAAAGPPTAATTASEPADDHPAPGGRAPPAHRAPQRPLLRAHVVLRHAAHRRGQRRGPGHRQGETVALVGESGSGKTTLGRATLHLVPISAGRIVFEGTDIGSARGPRAAPLPAAGPGHLPGPLLQPEPVHARRRDRRGAARHPRPERRAERVRASRPRWSRSSSARPRSSPRRTRTRSPAGSASASASRGPWCWTPTTSWPTSRSP